MKKYTLKPEYKNMLITIPNHKMNTGTITINTKEIDDYNPETLINLGFHIFDITETNIEIKKYTNEKNERRPKRS